VRFFLDDTYWTMLWRLFALALIFMAIVFLGALTYRGGISAKDVADGHFMRGLITAVLLVVTLVLVITVVLTALFASGDESTGKRVALARDVLAPLFGILGTIIGFYFGSQTGGETSRPPAAVTPSLSPMLPPSPSPISSSSEGGPTSATAAP
jgi:hypothetical protein